MGEEGQPLSPLPYAAHHGLATLEAQAAPSHFPVEEAEVVNRRDSFLDSHREEVIEEETAPVSSRKLMFESSASQDRIGGDALPPRVNAGLTVVQKDEMSVGVSTSEPQEVAPAATSKPQITATTGLKAAVSEPTAASSSSETMAEAPIADEPWSAVDFLTLGVSRLLTPRGSSLTLE